MHLLFLSKLDPYILFSLQYLVHTEIIDLSVIVLHSLQK